jgi:hypothetical protein
MVVLRFASRHRRHTRRGFLHQAQCHDHNWGEVPIQTLTRNWHWARASVGPYTIIASHITAPAYGYETQIVCMLAMDSKISAEDYAKVTFETHCVAIDGYTYRDARTRDVVSLEREKTILQAILANRVSFLKQIIARLIGFRRAYHRLAGKVTIERLEGAPELSDLMAARQVRTSR